MRPIADWPINRALRGIGVAATGTADEFETFGLGSCRHSAGIAECAQPRD